MGKKSQAQRTNSARQDRMGDLSDWSDQKPSKKSLIVKDQKIMTTYWTSWAPIQRNFCFWAMTSYCQHSLLWQARVRSFPFGIHTTFTSPGKGTSRTDSVWEPIRQGCHDSIEQNLESAKANQNFSLIFSEPQVEREREKISPYTCMIKGSSQAKKGWMTGTSLSVKQGERILASSTLTC